MTEGIAGFLLKELNSSAFNYFLQNITETTTIEYQAQSTITTGFDVTNSEPNGNYIIAANANVSLQAGEEIVFEPGTEIYGEMQACIVPELDCESSGKTDQTGGTNWQEATESGDEEQNSQPETLDKEHETTFNLYPNPNNGEFIIVLENVAAKNTIVVYNLLGKQVASFQTLNSTTNVNLSNQPKGTYLVKVITGEQVFTEKVVVR